MASCFAILSFPSCKLLEGRNVTIYIPLHSPQDLQEVVISSMNICWLTVLSLCVYISICSTKLWKLWGRGLCFPPPLNSQYLTQPRPAHFSWYCTHSIIQHQSASAAILGAGDIKVSKTDKHSPCFQGAHILVEEKNNEKVTNQVFPDFQKCSEET